MALAEVGKQLYLLSLNVNVYERLYYCILIKENHNAEKAFSVTTFGFEIKIMDKYCVCGKQPRIRSGLQTHPVQKQNESVLLLHHILYMHCRRSMNLLQQIYFNTRGSATKSCMTNAWQKKISGFLFFCHMAVLEDILLRLYVVIILPYVCSRDMLQLFDKALIGFLLEIHFKFALNAFDCKACLCVSKSWLKSKSQNWSKKSR